jgi:hypothetical protein
LGDKWMIDLLVQADFPEKAQPRGIVLAGSPRSDLDGDVKVQQIVSGQPDNTVAASANHALKHVITD